MRRSRGVLRCAFVSALVVVGCLAQAASAQAAPQYLLSIGAGPSVAHPVGVATDANGNVYVADTDNNRIVKLDSHGTPIKAWGSEGSGDGQFEGPDGVAIDADGNVYVTDAGNNRIQKFDADGTFIRQWGSYGS